MKKVKNRNCIICQKEYFVKYPSSKVRTCSKKCKNELARQNTILQFSIEGAQEKTSQAVKQAMATPDIRKKFEEGMKQRRSYAGENHPSYGMTRTPECCLKISEANKGRFKWKTWEEIIGESRANERKLENSLMMSKTNSKLLNSRTSKLENKIATIISPLGFEQNKRIHKYTVDFINDKEKLIIEIYGDYWHCNPTLYKADYINVSIDMTAQEKWDYDFQRINNIQSFGYTCLIFWEQDLNKQGFEIVKSAIADFKTKRKLNV